MTEPRVWSADQVKELTAAVLTEKDRAIAMADDEREKAASALRSEQQRREDQATAERDKAAENLRIELARAIKEGDDRLREHILNQIERINADLVSADKLELERIKVLAERIEAVNREITISARASSEAIAKAESATEKRFESVNEFRAQLSDQATKFMPREVGEQRLSAVENWQSRIIGALVLITVVLPVVVAFAVYLLTRHSIPAKTTP